MLSTFCGIEIASKARQPSNALDFIVFKLLGRVMFLSFAQLLKTLSIISSNSLFSSNSTEVKSHPEKGKKLLMCRNSHKSAYNALLLNDY